MLKAIAIRTATSLLIGITSFWLVTIVANAQTLPL